ncbi:DUF5348 domain-containing protein [Paenibacillus barcinonensis]|uniref:DUF5348 domain-containing protein n=1 Tax=Paenibacillus barcinonensis TaxID=198119 RepID=A0A2V4WNR6_PAEBA|nr:DUF5348 domain-containing protein [Paenibacillus barcinonensis]PYE49352.1 hypothetical protein DFQ00_106338 [Paenibacillus barcinonensis]QKS55562.1 DUF5348 domain-containing protein [Paenibacillus barcinonensis]
MKEQIEKELKALLPRIQQVVSMIKESEENWTADYDPNDPDEQYLRCMLYKASDLMNDATRVLTQAFAEVRDEGYVQRNSSGRYELNGRELFSSSNIEFLATDFDPPRWVAARVEHYDGDYRLVNHREIPLDGLRARNK